MQMFSKRLIWKSVASLVIAHIIVAMGSDNWAEMMSGRGYYFYMLIAFVSVFIVFEYVDRMTHYLDTRWPWRDGLLLRILLQVLLVVALPAMLAIVITFVQWHFVYDQNLIRHGYFAVEFPVTVLLIVIVNLAFIIHYLVTEVRNTEDQVLRDKLWPGPSVVLARKGNKNIPIPVSETAYLSLRNGVIFITTTDGTDLMLSDNLDFYEKSLSEQTFFRANRQTIIHRMACKSFRNVENGKIEVQLQPDTVPSVIVSQKKAAAFRKWIRS